MITSIFVLDKENPELNNVARVRNMNPYEYFEKLFSYEIFILNIEQNDFI